LFDHLTDKKTASEAGRKGLFLIGSSAVQVGIVIAVMFVASMIKARVMDEPVVPVKLVRTVPVPPAAPPAAPPQPPLVRRRQVAAPRPPAALIAPRSMPVPAPTTPEPEEEATPVADASETVVGGSVGNTDSPAPAPSPPAPPPPVKDEPAYAGAGFVRPRLADKSCMQARLRVPRGLEGMAAELTAKFAIAADGTPGRFSVQPVDVDARLAAAIWEAIRSCRWIAGTDPQGKAAKIWVLMPFRFQAN
jgi:periplasmic protein TonB